MTIDNSESDLTQNELLEAFKKLQEGEQTAEKMERMLDQLEGKIEAILAETTQLSAQKQEEKSPGVQQPRNCN